MAMNCRKRLRSQVKSLACRNLSPDANLSLTLALLNNFNGRKERNRTTSKKEESHDGTASGTASRCISPEPFKEVRLTLLPFNYDHKTHISNHPQTIPAYEPLYFPLTDVSIQKMKRVMPSEHLKQVERYFMMPSLMKMSENQAASQPVMLSKRPRQQKRRKHNDSISESKLIKEKLPSSSLATIGKNINVLIPRNNHNILESIDLTATDGAVLKQLMNNNNGDLNLNGGDFGDTEALGGDSDSETVTGDESEFGIEDESDTDDYTIENDRKHVYKKRNSVVAATRLVNQ